MSVVQLGELMATNTPSLNPAQFQDEEFELWSIPAFDVGFPEPLKGSEIGSAKKIVQPGDVLLSRIVPHIRRSWVVSENADGLRQVGSGEWIIFRSKRFDPNYLRHFLISDVFHPQFMQTVAGVGGSLLRARSEGVKEISFYLPPLEEQKRIAAILDQADELRRKRKQALDRLNQLGQAIFYEMFGDPLGIPSDKLEWTTEPLEKNVEFMDYRGKTPLKAETGIRLITARNVKMGFITLEPQEFVEEDSYDTWMTRGFPEIGDVLFTTEAPLGHVAQLAISEKVVIGQRLITMKPNRFVIRPTYLEFFLRTPSFRTLMFKNSTGSTVVGIKSKLLKKIAIRYPSGLEQDRFEEAIQQLRSTKPKLENAFEQTNNIFLSLQHRAFRGEL
jgi:type I restriction enzyme S subunit